MTTDTLATTLFDMYSGARHGEKTTMIHLFGIKYADDIRDCGASVAEIVRLSSIEESYVTEVHKGIRLARYVTVHSTL